MTITTRTTRAPLFAPGRWNVAHTCRPRQISARVASRSPLGYGPRLGWTIGCVGQVEDAARRGGENAILVAYDVLNARRGLSGATVGAIVLSLGAAVAVALGLWPRLSEYR